MHTFISGNLWETTVQVCYLRHSHAGEAAVSKVEFRKGWAISKSIKVTKPLQSPQNHKELIGGGQQLKRGTIRTGVSVNRVRVLLKHPDECLSCEADTLRGLVVPDFTLQSWPGWVILLWQPTRNSISQRRRCWYLSRSLSNMEFECGSKEMQCMSHTRQWGSNNFHVMKPYLPKGFSERQPRWSQIQVVFHKSNDLTSLVLYFTNPFEKPTLFYTFEVKGFYYQWFQIQLTWLNSWHYILTK